MAMVRKLLDKARTISSAYVISGTALLIAVGHIAYPTLVDNTVIVLCILAASPWLLPTLRKYIRTVEAFGTKVEFLEDKVDRQARRIDDLYFLSIGDKLLTHLRKLGRPGGYGEFHVGIALPRELEHLENLGYIRFKGEMKGIDDFLARLKGKTGSNLSEHVQLTEVGQSFLERLESVRSTAIKPAVN
jgi:hypothetical protein